MKRARILLLSANPASTARLALDEEARAIQARLRQSGAAERIELSAEWALRADELPAALMRHQPQVVHFSGHGGSAGELYLSSGKADDITPVSAETLRRIFEPLAADISCVVLNACYSAKQAEALAQILPCVVGMSEAVKDTAAIAFAIGFYEALAFGKSVEAAFKLGCAQIELAQQNEQREVPKLLLRSGTDAAHLYPFGAQTADLLMNARQRIDLILKTDLDLDAFCIHHYPHIYQRFYAGMKRQHKINLLLQLSSSKEVETLLDEITQRPAPLRKFSTFKFAAYVVFTLIMTVLAADAYYTLKVRTAQDEYIKLLEFRADSIIRELKKQGDQKSIDDFERLHSINVNSIKKSNFIISHETANQIQIFLRDFSLNHNNRNDRPMPYTGVPFEIVLREAVFISQQNCIDNIAERTDRREHCKQILNLLKEYSTGANVIK